VKPKPLLFVSVVLAAAVPVFASLAGARSIDAAADMHSYVPASSSKLKLPLLKIGSIAPLSTVSVSHPALAAAIVAGVRSLNRRGGLHGHPLALDFCDEHSDPNQAATCARQLVSDGVVATVGVDSVFDSAIQPILEAAGIPMIASTPISPAAINGKNQWLPTGGASTNSYFAMVGYAVHVAHDIPIAGFVNDVGAAKAFASTVENMLKPINSGQGFAAMVTIPPGTADFTPIGAAVARVNPLGVMSFAGGTNGLSSMHAANQVSTGIRHFYFPWGTPPVQLQSGAPDVLPKLIHAQSVPPLTDPRMALLLKDLKADVARGDTLADPKYVDESALTGWIGVQALVAVTKGLKTITPQTITNALSTAKSLQVGPYIPPWTPNAPGPSFAPRAPNTSYYFVTYKNGQQVLLIKHPVTVADALAGKFS
jgi:ABC-type branched-subunit amino acid transport system substrate-binding protein